MLPDLNEIKLLRKKLGLTQSELASMTGVSQSLITKIEAGKLNPTYSNAKRLFDTLESMDQSVSVKASEIMNTKIIKLKSNETLKSAINTMKKHGISQLPVFEDEKIVGTVSEKNILQKLHDSNYHLDLSEVKVKDAMEEAMPTIQENAPFSLVSTLLEHNNAVLVVKKGQVKGIITKSDLLGVI